MNQSNLLTVRVAGVMNRQAVVLHAGRTLPCLLSGRLLRQKDSLAVGDRAEAEVLGAVMDVAMSIASAIAEIHVQNPALSRRALFRAGMHVGRDMMGTDSNTLILAFAGGSISMLVLDYAYNLPYRQIINSNNIGIAIMQGLSGSFGIVLAVPVTVALAVLLYTWRKAAPTA